MHDARLVDAAHDPVQARVDLVVHATHNHHGPDTAFAVNAACYAIAIALYLRWRPAAEALPPIARSTDIAMWPRPPAPMITTGSSSMACPNLRSAL